MGLFADFQIQKRPEKHEEQIRVYNNQHRIKATLTIARFIDKDTDQHVFYMPALELSSYGETQGQASEMLQNSLQDFFKYILDLSPNAQQRELFKFGFKQQKFQNKNYSKAYVDITGELKNFNAVDNKIEILSLVA